MGEDTREGRRERASVVCVEQGQLLCVRMRDPVSGVRYTFPPGGEIERGEQPDAAAVRETLEETGYRVRLVPGAQRVSRYPFTWAGVLREVTTSFFGAVLVGARGEQAAYERDAVHDGPLWIAADAAALEAAFGFERAILEPIRELVKLLEGTRGEVSA